MGSCVSHTEHPGNRGQQVIGLAGAAQLPPCGARCVQWVVEPVDASTTPHLEKGAVPSLGHVMLPGSPVIVRGNRHGHSRDPCPFGHRSSPEAPSLCRHYPASSVLQASPPPCRPDLGPRGLSVGACHATRTGLPVLRPFPSSMRAAATTPAEPVGACVARFPTDGSLPRFHGGSASALRVSGPARRSLVLRPAWSLSRPWRPVASECFRRCRYLHHPLRLLPAGTTVAGRDSHPLKNGAFHGAREMTR